MRLLGLGKGAEIGATIAIELDGKAYAPIHDQNGNIVKLLDAETGTIAATYRYTAFGEEISLAQVKNPWRYASKRVDDESGFIYFGRRYYAPQFGRWITPDPIGFEDGPNLYAYVHNRPLTHFDAYGLEDAGDGGGFFGFSWGGMCDGLCKACSVVANTTCEFGVGMFNGYTSPIDTAGGWINGQNGDGGSPSIAKRFGEVCGGVKSGSRKRFRPDPYAEGAHTVFRRDPNTGEVGHYETFIPQTNPRDPKDWESLIRFDNPVDKHYHFNKVTKEYIYTPHVHDPHCPGGIRYPKSKEIP